MLKIKIKNNWLWFGQLVLFTLVVIHARPLIPIDETRYLSVAWEMWQNNDFLVPHINGLPYSHKPPLFFWTIHLFWWIFGVGQWSARLVAPFFGFIAILLTIGIAKKLWPSDGWVARNVPFILLGMVVWGVYTSLTMFDTMLICFCLLAYLFIIKAARQESFFPWFGLGCAIGLGLLAKGPVVLVYVLPPALSAPWWKREGLASPGKWYGGMLFALAVGVGIGLCWAIPAAKAGGPEYGRAILFGQTAGRVVNSFAHGRPFYWYFLLLPMLLFPWSFWLPSRQGFKGYSLDQGSRFCLAVLLPAFIILSSISGKQIHYILPLLPVTALLLARLISGSERFGGSDRIIISVFMLMFIVFSFLALLNSDGGDRELLQFMPRWIGVVPFFCGCLLFWLPSSGLETSIRRLSATAMLLVLGLHLAISPALFSLYGHEKLGEIMGKIQKDGGQIAVLPGDLKDQFQFAGRLTRPVAFFDNWHLLVDWMKAHPEQYVLLFTRDSVEDRVRNTDMVRRYKNGWLTLARAGNFFPGP